MDLSELRSYEQAKELTNDLLKKWLVQYKFSVTETKDLRVFVESSQYEIFDLIISGNISNAIEIRLEIKDVSKRSVIVRVLDSEKIEPINGAEVVLIANGNVYSQSSDSNGITKFVIGFPTDEIDGDISVSSSGFNIEHQRITLQADRVQDINLNKTTGELTVSFTDPQEPTINPTPTDDSGQINLEIDWVKGLVISPAQVVHMAAQARYVRAQVLVALAGVFRVEVAFKSRKRHF